MKLGSRALGSFRVWLTIVLWTFFFSEGIGFGGAMYQNDCRGVGSSSYSCLLRYHPVFPPHVPFGEFLGNVATLWFSGLYDSGITFGFMFAVAALVVATQLTRETQEKIFSWPVILIGCAAAFAGAFGAEVHHSLSTGVAHVQLL